MATGSAVVLYAEEGLLHDQARTHLRNGHYTEAQALLTRLLSDDPTNEVLYLQYAFSYEQQGSYSDAISILERGLQYANRYSAELYYNLANAHFGLRNYTQAAQYYDTAIRSNPSFLPSYVNRANLRIKKRDYRGALEDYSYYVSSTSDPQQRGEINGMIAILRNLLAAEEARKREELLRQERLLQETLRALQGSDQDGVFLQNEGENLQEIQDELDIID